MSDWQPIETAPKDGTYVMVWPPTYSGAVSCAVWDWQTDHKRPRPFWQRLDTDSAWTSRNHPPTHWMPVPEGPEEAKP